MGSARVQPSASRPTASSQDNLPPERTSFVGRKKEVAEIERLLSERQLLTLCGPGGAGKTRLALAAARNLAEGFEGGAWWVELAALPDRDLLPQAVAQALGVREAPDRSATEALAEHLVSEKTLLVLDNCEHLIEACADLADALLVACPDLKILATSREPLRVAGETSFMVPSLSTPDLGSSLSIEELAACAQRKGTRKMTNGTKHTTTVARVMSLGFILATLLTVLLATTSAGAAVPSGKAYS